MSTAKKIRLGRIVRKTSGKSILIPVDHGLTAGPIAGLESAAAMARFIAHPAVDGIIAHKGMIERLVELDLLGGLGVILHVNGMAAFAEQPDDKVLLTAVETAERLGADAVSLQINFTGRNDAGNFRTLGLVADEAYKRGFPVLTMLYDKTASSEASTHIRRQRHLLRAAIELGSDFIKISADPYIEDILPDVCQDARIVVAGGSLAADSIVLNQFIEAIDAGAAGVCAGRNVFGRADSATFLTQLAAAVHGPKPAEGAMAHAL